MNLSTEKFQFKTQFIGGIGNFTLPEIKDIISQNARKRLIHNWWFTNRKIHNATISAINFYTELPDREKYHNTMQDILKSHAAYLYSPIHWNTKKHLMLIDLFMNEAKNKRLDLTLLDIDHQLPGFGPGMLTGIIASQNKNQKK